MIDEALATRIHQLIQEHPTFGYRRIWALLRFRDGLKGNRKKVHGRMIVRHHADQALAVRTAAGHAATTRPQEPQQNDPEQRALGDGRDAAMDVTHVHCGEDGWGHLVAVVDCHDREVVGWEFALRGHAKEAERALEAACIRRFGTLRPVGDTPTIRSDNGLIFQSRRFREACRFYRLRQEYITLYTPEQNGLVERFESPRVCWRLQTLRTWSHEQDEKVLS